MFSEFDELCMARALELAELGRGAVEPNPMVGCVVAVGPKIVAEGWHQKFGGPHAEVLALEAAKESARGATLYVTLEPCSHTGKTPPCVDAVLKSGVRRVVVAMQDPYPDVSGRGLRQLRQAGLQVDVGLNEEEALSLNAPYLKLLQRGQPWVIAKWAMTLDGRIATSIGDSKWISDEFSRAVVHELRGRVDAIMVGSATAAADNPQLTARPAGPRTALRIVVDGSASLSSNSQLAQTARQVPVLIAVSRDSMADDRRRLSDLGCEVLVCDGPNRVSRLESLLDELGRRRMTNLLVEGGSRLLGNLFDIQAIDEVHCFLAPKLIGGISSPGPIGGNGIQQLRHALPVHTFSFRRLGSDLHLHGRLKPSG